MAGIYLHIPFCRKACHYCNFHFSTSLQLQDELIAALLQEMEIQQHYLDGEPVETIYFGGGTPSLLSSSVIEKMVSNLHRLYKIENGVEITLEANPDDVNKQVLQEWKNTGINRLSMGIQSFFEEDLQWMNRAHTATQAHEAIEQALEAGFGSMTIDLIYGTPGLTNERWIQNIEMAARFQVPHLSCYALTVEPGTALNTMIEKGKKEPVDANAAAAHFEILTREANRFGYEHYEISNLAKPGFRSKHNSAYWQGKPYLGIGPSAHSFNGVSRQWNVSNNALYIQSLKQNILPFEQEILSETDKLNEYIMTSLRLLEGMDLVMIRNRFGIDKMNKLIEKSAAFINNNQATMEDNRLYLTNKGRLLADGIAAELFF
jgi:oxygen-independent coproporphyrinogen III oxidase